MGFFSSLKHMDAVCQEKILIQMPGLMNIIVKSFFLFVFVCFTFTGVRSPLTSPHLAVVFFSSYLNHAAPCRGNFMASRISPFIKLIYSACLINTGP